MLKKLALAGVTSALLISVAHAQDVEPTVFNWTGAYVGLQAGYAWDNGAVNWEKDPGFGVTLEIDNLDPDGFVGGLHLGYLLQSDGLVFGIEGDIEYSDINGSSEIFSTSPPPGPVTDLLADLDYNIDWLGSVRLRLGYTWDRVLLYATGGVAVGGVSFEADVSPSFPYSDRSEDGTEWGWTLGGGLDYAIWDNVSIRLEYRYTDLGKSDAVVYFDGRGGRVDLVETEVDNTFHAVRGGISWRFR